MINDGMTLAADLDRLSADAARVAERLRRAEAKVSRDTQQLTVREASELCLVTDQAIYNWIDHSDQINRPIAIKRAGVWMIDTFALLSYVAKYRGGMAAKVAAETRLRDRFSSLSSREAG